MNEFSIPFDKDYYISNSQQELFLTSFNKDIYQFMPWTNYANKDNYTHATFTYKKIKNDSKFGYLLCNNDDSKCLKLQLISDHYTQIVNSFIENDPLQMFILTTSGHIYNKGVGGYISAKFESNASFFFDKKLDLIKSWHISEFPSSENSMWKKMPHQPQLVDEEFAKKYFVEPTYPFKNAVEDPKWGCGSILKHKNVVIQNVLTPIYYYEIPPTYRSLRNSDGYKQDEIGMKLWPNTHKSNCCVGSKKILQKNGQLDGDICKIEYNNHHCTTPPIWPNSKIDVIADPIDFDEFGKKNDEPDGVAWYPWSKSCTVNNTELAKKFCSEINTTQQLNYTQKFDEHAHLGTETRINLATPQCTEWINNKNFTKEKQQELEREILTKFCEENPTDPGCGIWCAEPGTCDAHMKQFCRNENLELPVCHTFCEQNNVSCDPALRSYCSDVYRRNKDRFEYKNGENNSIMQTCGCFMPAEYMDRYWNSMDGVKISDEKRNEIFHNLNDQWKIFECDNKTKENRSKCEQLEKEIDKLNKNKTGKWPIPQLDHCFYPPCSMNASIKPQIIKSATDSKSKLCPNVKQCIQETQLSIDAGGKVKNIVIDQKIEGCDMLSQPKIECLQNPRNIFKNNECIECPINQHPNGDQTECVAQRTVCKEGEYYTMVGEDIICKQCPHGHVPTIDFKACQECDYNASQNPDNWDECKILDCDPLEYIDNHMCIKAPDGHVPAPDEHNRMTYYKYCGDDFITTPTGNCYDCSLVNMFANHDQTKCLACSHDTFMDSNGVCQTCPPGSIPNELDDRNSCVPCGDKEISIGRKCEECKSPYIKKNNECVLPLLYKFLIGISIVVVIIIVFFVYNKL